MKIVIIGLGYVALPLCLQFARNDVQVIGLDTKFLENIFRSVKIALVNAMASIKIPSGKVWRA